MQVSSPAQHIPIMVDQVINNLVTDKNGCYIDATFGDGGHTKALLQHTDKDSLIVGIDRDSTAIARGRCTFSSEQRLILHHGQFSALPEIVQEFNREVNGILLDLGISSRQLDDGERGFSFLHDGPLDMRMDITKGIPLSDWLAKASQQDLTRVLADYGDEPKAATIARAIIDYRKKHKITTSSQLTALILKSKPRGEKIHPATRSFQSFRIFINQEIEELQQVLDAAPDILVTGGRLAVITFHSIEARLVKQLKSRMKDIYKSKPDRDELLANRRSRSSVLRILEKTV